MAMWLKNRLQLEREILTLLAFRHLTSYKISCDAEEPLVGILVRVPICVRLCISCEATGVPRIVCGREACGT